MFKLFITSLIFLSIKINGQTDSVINYYDNGNIESTLYLKDNMRDGEAKFYWKNGKLKEELNYSNGRINGLVRRYDENGQLREMFTIENGKREGPTSLFDSTGTYIKDIFYEEGIMVVEKIVLDRGEPFREKKNNEEAEINSTISENEQNSESSEPLPPVIEEEHNYEKDSTFYLTADVMSEPIGGINAILKKIIYPENAKQNNIEGVVKILTFIDRDGEVLDAQVVNGIGYGCDEAARLAVFYHRFKPGLIKGQRVKTQLEIPIEFKLAVNE
ncbi:MAG: TonB family protein [Ignavibacteriales bacterium]